MTNKTKSVVQIKTAELGLESMEKLGKQFSSIGLIAAPITHKYLNLEKGVQDRTEERGTIEIEFITGYDLKKEKTIIKDGKVQLIDGSWVDVCTGLSINYKEIQRSLEQESWETIIDMTMDNKLAVAAVIGSSRAASKRAIKKRMAKTERALKLLEEISKE